MHFLLRDSDSQGSESPHSVIVPNRRVASPTPGSSTLITSAPNSPSCVAAKGPARNDGDIQHAASLQGLNIDHQAAPRAITWRARWTMG